MYDGQSSHFNVVKMVMDNKLSKESKVFQKLFNNIGTFQCIGFIEFILNMVR